MFVVQAACANSEMCEAFTFVKEAKTCWLKGSGYSSKSGVSGVISGLKEDFVVEESSKRAGRCVSRPLVCADRGHQKQSRCEELTIGVRVHSPAPPDEPHPADHVTAPDLTKEADAKRAAEGPKNIDPTVSVAQQTAGYATPSTYSAPSSGACTCLN